MLQFRGKSGSWSRRRGYERLAKKSRSESITTARAPPSRPVGSDAGAVSPRVGHWSAPHHVDHRPSGCSARTRVRGSTARDRRSGRRGPRRSAALDGSGIPCASTGPRHRASSLGARGRARSRRCECTRGRDASRSRCSSVSAVQVVQVVALLLSLLFFTREKVERGWTAWTSPLPHWDRAWTASWTAPGPPSGPPALSERSSSERGARGVRVQAPGPPSPPTTLMPCPA